MAASTRREKELMDKVREAERRISELIVLKPELDKLRSKHNQVEVAKNMCEQKTTKLEEAIKKLRREKEDLQHMCAKLSGQCGFNDSKITKLKEQNQSLSDHLDKAKKDAQLYESQCRELIQKVAEAGVAEKAYHGLQNQYKKLMQEHDTCLSELDKLKMDYKEKLQQFKDLKKANDAADSAIRRLTQDIEKKQTQIKLVEQERDGLKEEMQSQVVNVKELKHLTKKYEKINQIKDEDIMHLHMELKDRENEQKVAVRKVEPLTTERDLLAKKLFKADEDISKLGKEKSVLERRIQKLLTTVNSQTSALEKGSMKNDSLEKQLAKLKRQEEAEKQSGEQHKMEKQKEIDMLNINITNLEKDVNRLTATKGACEKEICILRKRVVNLESLLFQAKTESAKHQKEVNFYISELNKDRQQHHITLKRMARQVNQFHKPKNLSFKRWKEQYQWTRAITEMLREYKLSGKKQVKILHQPCANEIKNLRHENEELKSKLSRRPDKPYADIYWCKKSLQKSEEKVKLLKTESEMYYRSWLKEREEKDALQQEARKLRSMVKKQLENPEVQTKRN